VTSAICPTCHAPLADPPAFKLRYESNVYAFDKEVCKRIFQENPDRYLDADGGVRPEPR
jgi:YHS domain-containing protein